MAENEDAVPIQRSLAVWFCLALNILLTLYFFWLFYFQGAPLLQFFAKHGFPSKPEVWKPLQAVMIMTAVPFCAAALSSLTLERLWMGRPGGIVLQSALCLLIAANFPVGTLAGFLGLGLLLFDAVTKKSFSLMKLCLGAGVGTVLAFCLYFTNYLWVIDFNGAIRQMGISAGVINPQTHQEPKSFRGLPDLFKLFQKREKSKTQNTVKPAPKEKSAPQFSGARYQVVLKNGRTIQGQNYRQASQGYYLTLDDLGEIYFSENETASIQSLNK